MAFKATMIGNLPILSVFRFVGMFGGVVLAITGPRMGGGRDKSGSASGAPRQRPAKHSRGSFTGPWKIASDAASISRQQY